MFTYIDIYKGFRIFNKTKTFFTVLPSMKNKVNTMIYRWMDGWMDGWIDMYMARWVSGWVDEWVYC